MKFIDINNKIILWENNLQQKAKQNFVKYSETIREKRLQ